MLYPAGEKWFPKQRASKQHLWYIRHLFIYIVKSLSSDRIMCKSNNVSNAMDYRHGKGSGKGRDQPTQLICHHWDNQIVSIMKMRIIFAWLIFLFQLGYEF